MWDKADETEHLPAKGPDVTVAGLSLIGKPELSSAPSRGRSMAGGIASQPGNGRTESALQRAARL